MFLCLQILAERKWLEQVENSGGIWTLSLLNKTIGAGEKLAKSCTVEGHLEQLKKRRSEFGGPAPRMGIKRRCTSS